MKHKYFLKYYRVFKNETAVTTVSTNDFRPVTKSTFKDGKLLEYPFADGKLTAKHFKYSLPADELMFYGYTCKVQAMEKAKAGALLHITKMIDEITLRIKKLKDYRMNHHDDLNIILLDANIRKLEQQMHIK